ncbi:hypothetical protein KpCCI2_13630 [Klebsiella pneumoniae]|nr:hypothetical protein KpCCI2_13630 [Klebsiella pneumoniae]GKM62842.1 hypothetical protein NUBL21998_10800 [Klebsiella pneumoniae]
MQGVTLSVISIMDVTGLHHGSRSCPIVCVWEERMGTPQFTPEFKEEAVRQTTKRGYSVAEAPNRLGVSAHSLY